VHEFHVTTSTSSKACATALDIGVRPNPKIVADARPPVSFKKSRRGRDWVKKHEIGAGSI